MPPTRGHDLKHGGRLSGRQVRAMPPTRGHDLKHGDMHAALDYAADAPHTGARLETLPPLLDLAQQLRCPPHGGTT